VPKKIKGFKVEGLRELEAALSELPKATQKNVLKRVMMPAADPIERAAESNAPEMTGRLERDIKIGTKLTRGQRTGGAKLQANGSFRSASKNYVELHIGTALSRAMFTEFGTYKDAAQMWFTRAFEATKHASLAIMTTTLGPQIETAAARLRKKGKL
jgi:HK97 gp10 family phage protein